jgi:hypothetical protein
VKIARWESHHDEVEGLGPTYNTWVHDGVDYYDDYHHIKEVVYIGHDLMKWYKEEIDHLRNCYYNGVPEISDKAYDELIRSYNEDKKRFEEAE